MKHAGMGVWGLALGCVLTSLVPMRSAAQGDATPSPTPASGRPVGDFDDSGCTDLADFLYLLDYWMSVPPLGGDPMGLDDFLTLLDNWQTGPGCPFSTATATPTASPTSTEPPGPSPTATPDAGLVFMLPGGVPLTMLPVPGGSFQMGSDDPGWSASDELPVRMVAVASGFHLGKFEVTQRQWLAVMGANPSYFQPINGPFTLDLEKPVEWVSWEDVQTFESAINALGLGGTFRLPTEAEWELAARGGTLSRFTFGLSTCEPGACADCDLADHAWGCPNAGAETHTTGQKLPNPFGFYDMSGNVAEWCEDWYHSDYTGAPVDGSAWLSPVSPLGYRCLRGGSWSNYGASRFRPSARAYASSSTKLGLTGFRIAWTP